MAQMQYQPEEKARLKRQWVEQAIAQALSSSWNEAVATNRQILSIYPNDYEAYNRLGKALSELGQYAEAKWAYSQTLKINPENTIARKNLERFSMASDSAVSTSPLMEKIDPKLFIEETGKTRFTELVNLADNEVLARVSAGEQVLLQADGYNLMVKNVRDEVIGQLDPRLSNRLINFMQGGNKYAAAVTEVELGRVKIIIRETYQDPSQFGKISFPAQGVSGETVRGYIKLRAGARGEEEEEFDEMDDDEEEFEPAEEEETEFAGEGEEPELEY